MTQPWLRYNELTQRLTINLSQLTINRPGPGDPLRYVAQLGELDNPILVRCVVVDALNLPPPPERIH